jgi:hypothetical protein
MPSSLASYLGTAVAFKTDLPKRFKVVSGDLVTQQNTSTRQSIRRTLSLTRAKKKQKITVSEPSQSSSEGSQSRKRKRAAGPTADQVVEDYIKDAFARIATTIDERRPEESRVRVLLENTVKQLGRDTWARARAGNGKLSFGRIQASCALNLNQR